MQRHFARLFAAWRLSIVVKTLGDRCDTADTRRQAAGGILTCVDDITDPALMFPRADGQSVFAEGERTSDHYIRIQGHEKHLLSSIEYHSGGRMGKRSFRKGVEILSDMEKKQLEDAAKMISHLDRELPKETKLMWLAYGLGLADGARSAKAD